MAIFPLESLDELSDLGLQNLLMMVENEIRDREERDYPHEDDDLDLIPDEIFDPADNGNQGS